MDERQSQPTDNMQVDPPPDGGQINVIHLYDHSFDSVTRKSLHPRATIASLDEPAMGTKPIRDQYRKVMKNYFSMLDMVSISLIRCHTNHECS